MEQSRLADGAPAPRRAPRGGPRGSAGHGRLLRSLLAWLPWLVLLGLIAWGPSLIAGLGAPSRTLSYTDFRDAVQAGRVKDITVKGSLIEGRFKKGASPAKGASGKASGTPAPLRFTTHLPPFGDSGLLALLEKNDVELNVKPQSHTDWLLLIVTVLPIALLVWLGFAFMGRLRQQGQQMFGMGKSRAHRYVKRAESTGFGDVAGAAGAKTELREIVGFLRQPAHYQRLGGKPPKGVLFVGPPGTGKTLLARATAGEAEVPFFSITGSDFMEMLVGVGASRVRDLFRDARRSAPAIVFIDELDSIGRRRGAGIGGGHDEREQTLNQLLSEMDGFEPNAGVIVMAATNRPDILDPALLRPGRFDRRISVELPGLRARAAILRIHARNKVVGPDVDLDDVARGTPGFSGADLENLLNEAALLAARRDRQAIGAADVEEARDKVLLGLEREGLSLTREECRQLAFHEGGHAVVAAVLPRADPVHKVSIVPRGRALGGTQQLPRRDRYVVSREFLLDRMAVMLGGRAAEEQALDSVTSGAEQDLREATGLARKMVFDWGMSPRFAHLALGGPRENVFLGEEIAARRKHSEETAREADEEVRALLEEAHRRAAAALREHEDGLTHLAEALLEHEELPGSRVLEILGLHEEAASGDDAPSEGDHSQARPEAAALASPHR
jgi:cell division protease FtsH